MEFVQGHKYMFRAQLAGADLSAMDLQWVDLHGANPQGANFHRAIVQRANMIHANLWDTGPQRALLNGTIFSDTLCKNTSLESAGLGGTIFSDCDLRHAIGLSEGIHHAPSTVGIDTIFQSRGNIPDHFLRQTGVPKNLIEAIPALIGNPWEYSSCLISYSAKNQQLSQSITAKTPTFALKFRKYEEK